MAMVIIHAMHFHKQIFDYNLVSTSKVHVEMIPTWLNGDVQWNATAKCTKQSLVLLGHVPSLLRLTPKN
jgi:hypothetical protein